MAAITLDKSENDDMTLTFHDSCNVARASRMGPKPGGQFVLPREVIKASCNNFYDMPQDTIHEATYCCGGGGGLLTDDLMELRVKGALPRMEALKTSWKIMVSPTWQQSAPSARASLQRSCPITDSMDQIVSVHQLVSNAIVLGNKQ